MQAWLPNEKLLSIRHDAGSRPLVHPPARGQGNPALLRPMPRRLNLETAVIPTGSDHLRHRRYQYAPLFLDWLRSRFDVVKELGQTSSSSSAHARCSPNRRSSHAPPQHHRGLDVPCRKNYSNAVPSDIYGMLRNPRCPVSAYNLLSNPPFPESCFNPSARPAKADVKPQAAPLSRPAGR